MKRLLAIAFALSLNACTPLIVQQPFAPSAAFSGPQLQNEWLVSFDGARLGLKRWEPAQEPWAVIVGLHGMNDYSNAFHLAAPWWVEQGIATYAYDQRGFGRSPARGIWAGDDLLVEDLRTVVALVRQKYPRAIIAVCGHSMGGAVAAAAFASDRPPDADRLVLIAPAVWGWKDQPLPNRTLLWLAANFTAGKVYTPPNWLANRVKASDNLEELIAMGHDRLMLWGARSDALYGLVNLMDRGAAAVGRTRAPTFFLYGAHDQIIPKGPAFRAAKRLKAKDRSAYYPNGYHLLMRDKSAPAVWQDIAAFIRDPSATLPSDAKPVPGAPAAGTQVVAAGL